MATRVLSLFVFTWLGIFCALGVFRAVAVHINSMITETLPRPQTSFNYIRDYYYYKLTSAWGQCDHRQFGSRAKLDYLEPLRQRHPKH
jgi:hypothetical protein